MLFFFNEKEKEPELYSFLLLISELHFKCKYWVLSYLNIVMT